MHGHGAFYFCSSRLALHEGCTAAGHRSLMLPRHFLPLVLLLVLLIPAAASAKGKPPLRVGIAGTAPFINGDTTGIAMDIWREIAVEMAQPYTIIRFASEHEALAALDVGQLDAVVGPVVISSDRAEHFDLTQPYFRASLAILSRNDEFDLWGRIRPFFSKRLLYATTFFLFILACVGTLLWLAERKDNEQFPTSPARGIGNGMWCAISTMTTTGYGDIAPITLAGRIIAGAWMVISILFATSMVAGIASTLTLTGMGHHVIDNADQFSGKKIAVLQDSPAAEFVLEHSGKPVPEADLEACYAALKNRRVDAVLFDRPQLLFFAQEKHDGDISVSDAHYLPEGYGFAFRPGSPYLRVVDVELLRMRENGALDMILENWLGPMGIK